MTHTNDEDGFQPYVPMEKVTVTVYKDEAVLLTRLRRYPYGKFIIHKANQKLIRVEVNETQLIQKDGEIDLE
jgi:hypothetical protein